MVVERRRFEAAVGIDVQRDEREVRALPLAVQLPAEARSHARQTAFASSGERVDGSAHEFVQRDGGGGGIPRERGHVCAAEAREPGRSRGAHRDRAKREYRSQLVEHGLHEIAFADGRAAGRHDEVALAARTQQCGAQSVAVVADVFVPHHDGAEARESGRERRAVAVANLAESGRRAGADDLFAGRQHDRARLPERGERRVTRRREESERRGPERVARAREHVALPRIFAGREHVRAGRNCAAEHDRIGRCDDVFETHHRVGSAWNRRARRNGGRRSGLVHEFRSALSVRAAAHRKAARADTRLRRQHGISVHRGAREGHEIRIGHERAREHASGRVRERDRLRVERLARRRDRSLRVLERDRVAPIHVARTAGAVAMRMRRSCV